MRVTLDTNVIDRDEIIRAGHENSMELAFVSVTGREVENTRFAEQLEKLNSVAETAVWDESRWGESKWGSPETQEVLETVLEVVANRSFPVDRGHLTAGQRRQLRDCMILATHVIEGRNIFVTDDIKGFIRDGRQKELEERLGTRIMTGDEFLAYCRKGKAD